MHTITQCAVGGNRLECDASVVVGPFSRVFYVSPKAVYVWAADWPYWRGGDAAQESSMLFRLPLDGGSPSALGVEGTPVDQFSFLESEDGHINVMVQPEGTGDWMWTAEWGRPPGADSLMLLRAPLARFDDGEARLALLGYELVEGAVDGGGMREVRRASFAPEAVRTTLKH